MKIFITGFLTFVLTSAILYIIGFFFHAELFMFHFYQTGKSKDVLFTAGGSLLPIGIGIIAAVFVLYIFKIKRLEN